MATEDEKAAPDEATDGPRQTADDKRRGDYVWKLRRELKAVLQRRFGE